MTLTFRKYQGTGNDFIMLDNRSMHFSLAQRDVQEICDRRFGVGSDGIILIEADSESDFYMRFYNPDGSQSFCGNGSRCAVHYFNTLSFGKETFSFRAIDGMHQAEIKNDAIEVHMKNVSSVVDHADGLFIHTGSPHLIKSFDGNESIDIVPEARAIRFNEEWKEQGVNVNFVHEISPGSIKVRTYERGVEAETLSCGTGVTAAALAYHTTSGWTDEVTVYTLGGKLKVRFEAIGGGEFQNIWLSGPAVHVFDGVIKLKK